MFFPSIDRAVTTATRVVQIEEYLIQTWFRARAAHGREFP
jgi:hypothetical protein